VFIFRRLKINHESHEFIFDPGTIANYYNWELHIDAVGVVDLRKELGSLFLSEAHLGTSLRSLGIELLLFYDLG
jgi:hypothetical protein